MRPHREPVGDPYAAVAELAEAERDLALAGRYDELEALQSRRAEAIIDELLATLDMSVGEVAERLQALYVFFKEHLSSARLEQDASKVDDVARFMGELRSAWAGIAGS